MKTPNYHDIISQILYTPPNLFREIMDPLIAPIYEKCLRHLEPYVRRSAVDCLYTLYCRFGEDLLEDVKSELETLLAKEHDLNTKRNALMFLFQVDRKAAVEFVQEQVQEEGVASFGDVLQLVIVRNLMGLCRQDDQDKGTYMKLLIEFLESKHQGVLFELSMNMIGLTRSEPLLKAALSQLLKVFLACADMNVKLVILDKLQDFKSVKRSYLLGSMVKLFAIFEREDLAVRAKTLKLLSDLVDTNNSDDFLKLIKQQLLWTVHAKVAVESLRKYQKRLLRLLSSITEPRPLGQSLQMNPKLLQELVRVVVTQKFEKGFGIVQNIRTVLVNLIDFQDDVRLDMLALLEKNLEAVQCPETLKVVFSLLAELMNGVEEVRSLIGRVFEILDRFSVKANQNKRKRSLEDGNEDEAKKPDEMIRKVVILEDGTYGSEMVRASDQAQLEDNNDATRYQVVIEAIDSDRLFLLNLLRHVARLIGLLPRKEARQTSALMLRKVLEIYRRIKKSGISDPFLFMELNKLLRTLRQTNLGQSTKKGFALRKKKQRPQPTDFASQAGTKNQKLSEFDDVLGFRGLKGRVKAEAYFDDGELFMKRSEGAKEQRQKVTAKLRNLVQLTGYSDPIYAECSFNFSKTNIDLEVFLQNRTESILKNVNINFFSSVNKRDVQNLRLLERVKLPYLMPNATTTICKSLKYDVHKEFQFFGDISCENNAGIPMANLRTSEICFNILEFLKHSSISTRQFRHLWQVCDWENKVRIKTRFKALDKYIANLTNKLSLTEVPDLKISHSKYSTFSMYTRFCLGKDLLINICVETNKGALSGHIRLRSQKMGLVVLVGKTLRNIQ